MALDLIGRLYRIEREIKTASLADRLATRRAQSAPIVRELKTWLVSQTVVGAATSARLYSSEALMP